MLAGEIQNGFAFVRPPGHHAEPGHAMGFCLFNNVAIAAAYALQQYGLSRILIIDFDVHHGNGTQHAFFSRNDILYFSVHQDSLFPGSGDFSEIGELDGRGYTVNFGLPAGSDDNTYNRIFQDICLPVGRAYQPGLILVSAGFDAYCRDPLAGMNVTPAGFGGMTQTILRLAEEVCEGRVLFVLEGGYDLAGLSLCVHQVLNELTGHSHTHYRWESTPHFEAALKKARYYLHPHWKF
jgi:acetoin utilization deacetylase AcuC-like enzyme